MKIEKPGIYRDFDTAAYFLDPTPDPSFTQSLAKILLDQSPLHAKLAHPRLSPPTADEGDAESYSKAMAIGNAAHSLLLGRGKVMAVAPFKDWRTKTAQDFRANALQSGQEPILQKHYDTAGDMVDTAIETLSRIHGIDGIFSEGDAEVVIANCENGTWLRSMIDWLSPDRRDVIDLKTTGSSVSPYATGRLMADAGWHIQAAMHERILDAVDPKNAGRRRHLFVAQENEPPYALTVNEISESAMTIGRKQIDYAIKMWSYCLHRNVWPSYPPKIICPELPGWTESAWLGREIAEASENDTSLMFAG